MERFNPTTSSPSPVLLYCSLLSPSTHSPQGKQHLVQGQRYTGQRGPCRPLACLIRGQKSPLECGCTLACVAESPCAGALGRLAALFPTAGLLCSSAQARPSCPRPQGCANSSAGQRLCIFKQLLKGHFRCGAAAAIGDFPEIESKPGMINNNLIFHVFIFRWSFMF